MGNLTFFFTSILSKYRSEANAAYLALFLNLYPISNLVNIVCTVQCTVHCALKL